MDKKMGRKSMWFICFDEIGVSGGICSSFHEDHKVNDKVKEYMRRGYDESEAKERAAFSLVLGLIAPFLSLEVCNSL
jgi:hypothetical protein